MADASDMLSASRGKALVVDDSFLTRRLLKSNLERLGFEVAEASGGLEALKIAKNCLPAIELLLVDLSMPGMSGADLIQSLKRMPEWSGTRILVCSGHTDEAEIRRVFEFGIDGYLAKPVSIQSLERKIKSLFP